MVVGADIVVGVYGSGYRHTRVRVRVRIRWPSLYLHIAHTSISKGLERKTHTAARSHEFYIMHARCVHTLCGYVCSLFLPNGYVVSGDHACVCECGTGNGLLHFNVPQVIFFFFFFSRL